MIHPGSFNLKIFLGSTWEDLQSERKAVRDAVLNIQANSELPLVLVGMEDFGPSDEIPLDLCVTKVLNSHAYVGIIGSKYGSCPPGGTESYTALEFQAAKGAGIPSFIFLKQPGPEGIQRNPHSERLLEQDEELEAILSFRNDVSQGRVVQSFKTSEELKTLFLTYIPPRIQEIFGSLNRWWPGVPGAVHYGLWINKLANVLTAADHLPWEFILEDAGLESTVGTLPRQFATRHHARTFILSFLLRAASQEQARQNLIRFVEALSRERALANQKSVLEEVVWELSGEAERAGRILFSDYEAEEERVAAIYEYLADHPTSLKQAFGTPGSMFCEVLNTQKLTGVPTSIEFIVASRTTLGYRLDLIKLLTSDLRKVDVSVLAEYERQLSDFVKDLPGNRPVLSTIDLLLDNSLRARKDQARLQIAAAAPVSSSPIEAVYHILVGQRIDFDKRLQTSGYVNHLKTKFGIQSKCVSYDRFIDAIKEYKGTNATYGAHYGTTRD
jgi:hypothetical protein